MTYSFELLLSKDAVTADDFQTLYDAITSYTGALKNIRFHIKLSDKRVQYFIESDHDLSSLSGNIDFAVLRDAKPADVALPTKTSKERLVNFVTGGSLLNLREKMSVKRGKSLEHFICNITKVTGSTAAVTMQLYFVDKSGNWSLSNKVTNKFPAHLFELDFNTSNTYMKKSTPKFLNIEKSLHLFIPDDTNAILEVDTFPYFQKPYYLNMATFEFDKHSLILGASGSGKSKFIQLFIDRLQRLPDHYNYRVAVIDPHANLAQDLQTIRNNKIFDFNGETAELFAGAEADITAATELTTTLMKDLMAEGFNPRSERVIRFSLYVLFAAQKMSLGMLKTFLTELEVRQEILDQVTGHVPANIIKFFNTDYNEIRTAYYNDGVMPIVAIVDELELQPALLQEGGANLGQEINNNFLTVFSLNKVSMGEKVVKTVAGLLIQQIFLLAQSRTFGQKVILFIDEVSIVQNPALASILSEARKFNLYVVLTQQYLAQVDKSLRDAIFANTSNYYTFRISEEDAQTVVGNIPMELQKQLLLESQEKGIDEETVKTRMLTELDPRDCIVRIAAGGSLLPAFKARTIDIASGEATIETALPDSFAPKTYAEPVESISDFMQRAEEAEPGKTIELQQAVETAEEFIAAAEEKEIELSSLPTLQPIQSDQELVPLPLHGGAPPPAQNISLDDIMQSSSTKNNP